MNIWEIEQRALKDKIHEERSRYLLQFNSDPHYVVIPLHYKFLLETSKYFRAGYDYDSYYGMLIIESKGVCSLERVTVF